MRKLASIQKIESIQSIPEKDRIQYAKVLEWGVVVDKSFKEGDLVIYAEIDSVFPETPEFEFLRQSKFRIKSKRLGGFLSQGICFPLSILGDKADSVSLDDDVTELLGITLYEEPESFKGPTSKGNFPKFLKKTDETRVQSIKHILEQYKGQRFVATEKLAGSSLSCYLKDDKFGICTGNLELTEDEGCRFWNTARKLKIEEILRTICRETGREVCFQGELIGEGIQKNLYKLQGNSYKIFTVFNITEQIYIDHEEVILLAKSGVLPKDLLVPILDDNISLTDDVEHLLKMAEIKSLLNPAVDAEGIVLRSYSEEGYHPKIGRLSFKVISNKYLLKSN